MADSKISALAALTSGFSGSDLAVVVDVSDTTMAASGTDKQITLANLGEALRSLGLAGLTTAKQSAQITNSSNTTASNITGLSFSVVSGRRYAFKFMGTFQTAATGTGIGFCFTGPAVTAFGSQTRIRQAADGTDSFWETSNVTTTLTTVAPNASVVAATTDYYWTVEGHITPSADGTLQLQCRSEVNASQVTVQNVGVGYLIDAG